MAQSFKCGKNPVVHSKYCLDCALKESTADQRVVELKKLFNNILSNGRDERESGFPLLSIWSTLTRESIKPPQVKSYAQDLVNADLIKMLIDLANKALDDRVWIREHNNIIFISIMILSNLAKVKEWHDRIYDAGAMPLLIKLIRGALTWFERFAAARVLYFLRFEFSKELIETCMDVAFEIFDVVYREYIKFPDERLFYQSELLTDGFHGGADWQSCMAMQWMDNTRCWLVHVLNDAAIKNTEEAANIICKHANFKLFYELVEIDLTLFHFGDNEQVNRTFMDALSCLSYLSHTKIGRKAIINELKICEMLRHTALTGMMVQHSAIEVVVNLYKDEETREKADEIFGEMLQDLVEFETFWDRRAEGKEFLRYKIWEELVKNLNGETRPFKMLAAAREVAEKYAKEAKMTQAELMQLSNKAKDLKNSGNKLIGSDVEAALKNYEEGVKICPIIDTETRVALFSNMSECYSRLKTKFADDPEKSGYYNKMIIKYATKTQAIQWQHGKTLWKRGKAFMDEKLFKAAYTEMYFFTRLGPMEPSVNHEFDIMCNIACSEVHPYKFLLRKYGPIERDSIGDEGPLWTRQEQVQCPRFIQHKQLIESRNTDVVPEVVLTRSDGPTQEEMNGNKI